MGISIIAIDEKEGRRIMELLAEIAETEKEILERVKRIPGPAVEMEFILGKAVQQ